MNKLLVIIAIVLSTLEANSQGTSQVKLNCDKKLSSISYSMNHPLHSWTGVCEDFSSVILTYENRNIINQVAVIAKVASFDSKNANRDSHVIEATEALKFPSISFSSNSIIQTEDSLAVTGTLNFHGVSRVISFGAFKNKINNKVEVTGNFIVKMTQFEIDPPSLMGLATDDEIAIDFNVVY